MLNIHKSYREAQLSPHRRWLLLCVLMLVLAACGRRNEEPTPSAAPAPAIDVPHLSKPQETNPDLTRLMVPSIQLETPIVALGWHPARNETGQIFSEWDVADNAAGWHKNSALPGQGGNVVLSGHNNIRGAVFRELDRLKKGDEAIVWYGNRKYTYIVERVMIVPEKYASPEQRAENAAWIGPFRDDRLTLVSCWPRDDNSHRIIVVAHPAHGSPNSQASSSK